MPQPFVSNDPVDSPDTVDGAPHDSQTLSPAVNFTFVNLNEAENLIALCHRRISNKEQRHTIRSHVMQRVRQVESAQGKKRLTGREHSKKPGKPRARKKSNDSDSPVSVESNAQAVDSAVTGPDRTRLTLTRSPRQSPRLTLSPAVHYFDPFDTLPTNTLPHQSSQSLLQYCFDVMLPLTFSVETNQPRERIARQGVVLSSKATNPATFLGFLATTAAHRAIMHGRHRDLAPSSDNHDDLILDPDYVRVKHEATIAVRQTFERCAIGHEHMLEACFGLIATATVVGNFEEAKVHLKILGRITSQIEVSEATLMWLPLSNVKVSVALLQRPVMPLLFKREPMPYEVLQRIYPRLNASVARLGKDFLGLDQLSDPLKLLLSTHADVCLLSDLNASGPHNSAPLEMATLSRKAIELEFDLLAYPYEIDAFPRDSHDEPQLPALEAVVRLAALGMLSIVPHTIMPATGNGRALTHHQKKALEMWVRERHSWHVDVLRVMCWTLLVFIQNSLKQPEEAFFTKLLAQVSRDLWVSTWEDVEEVVRGFLYIPKLQSSTWEAIWADVCKVKAQLYPQDTLP